MDYFFLVVVITNNNDLFCRNTIQNKNLYRSNNNHSKDDLFRNLRPRYLTFVSVYNMGRNFQGQVKCLKFERLSILQAFNEIHYIFLMWLQQFFLRKMLKVYYNFHGNLISRFLANIRNLPEKILLFKQNTVSCRKTFLYKLNCS